MLAGSSLKTFYLYRDWTSCATQETFYLIPRIWQQSVNRFGTQPKAGSCQAGGVSFLGGRRDDGAMEHSEAARDALCK